MGAAACAKSGGENGVLKRRGTSSLTRGRGREAGLVRLSDVVCQGKGCFVEETQD